MCRIHKSKTLNQVIQKTISALHVVSFGQVLSIAAVFCSLYCQMYQNQHISCSSLVDCFRANCDGTGVMSCLVGGHSNQKTPRFSPRRSVIATSICPISLYSADHVKIHDPVVLMSQSVEPIMEEEVNFIGSFANVV